MLEIASKSQLRWAFLRAAAIIVPLILFLGTLSARFGSYASNKGWYNALCKPEWIPSPTVFPIVWIILYILMGVAAAMVWHARGNTLRSLALGLFVGQLILNLIWSPVFFRYEMPGAAFAILVLLFLLAAATAYFFHKIRKTAGFLLIPYLLWLLVASALNFYVMRNNPNGIAKCGIDTPMIETPAGGNQQSPGLIPL